MDPNNYRRPRSPPVGYHQPRPPIDEYDTPHGYPPMDRYDVPSHGHPMGQTPMHPHTLPPHGQPPFMDAPPHDYPPDYRDHPRMHPNHRMTMTQRDPYAPNQVTHQQPSSPPYKILCITGINHKMSDGSVKEALTSDFSRFGSISVTICHDSGERLAYIYFRNYEEAREARISRSGTMLFDRQIEIEPIYEQDRSEPAGQPGNPAMVPNQSMYSPRRRSISPPPPNYNPEMKGTLAYRNPPVPPHRTHSSYGPPPNHLGYQYHRGSSPPDYIQHQPAAYPYGPIPPPPAMAPVPAIAYDRRVNYDDGYNHYPSPHAVNTASPYSTPPHEQYRPSYSLQPPASSAQLHLSSRPGRDRIPSDPRSPRIDPYHSMEQRAPPPPEYPAHDFHPSRVTPLPQAEQGRRRRRSRGGRRSRAPPADPPMRFMSREYRREKFGAEHGPVDHEEGKPSRVLLVNNIDSSKTDEDLRDIFESHGTLEDMEVKKVGPEISSAIVKFTSMDGAYKAKISNNGRFLGTTRCRIVYGKVSASRKLWIGGLSPSNTVASLEDECGRYGDIVSVEYTQGRPYCYVEFESANQAQFAAHHLKSTLTPAPERKIRVEFVDSERSERLVPRQETSSRLSDTGARSSALTESSVELDATPQSTDNMRIQKRTLSPTPEEPKRVCQASDLPFGSNTFKQERLAAAAAAKARSSSTTSSHPSERFESSGSRDLSDNIELNNNSGLSQTNSGDFDASQTPTAYERAPQEDQNLPSLSQCASIRELIDYCPVSWPGRLALKNLLFPAQLYLCSGSKELIGKFLSRPGEIGEMQSPLLSITQRWRLHPQPKLEVVKRRMQSGNLGILIITSRQEDSRMSSGTNINCDQRTSNISDDFRVHNGALDRTTVEDSSEVSNSLDQTGSSVNSAGEVEPDCKSVGNAANNSASTPNRPSGSNVSPATQSKSIRNLISYLGQKDAAGVISLSAVDGSFLGTPQSADNPPKLLYTFPPGEFALNLLQRLAPKLTAEASKEEFLLGVISRGNLEGKI